MDLDGFGWIWMDLDGFGWIWMALTECPVPCTWIKVEPAGWLSAGPNGWGQSFSIATLLSVCLSSNPDLWTSSQFPPDLKRQHQSLVISSQNWSIGIHFEQLTSNIGSHLNQNLPTDPSLETEEPAEWPGSSSIIFGFPHHMGGTSGLANSGRLPSHWTWLGRLTTSFS